MLEIMAVALEVKIFKGSHAPYDVHGCKQDMNDGMNRHMNDGISFAFVCSLVDGRFVRMSSI